MNLPKLKKTDKYIGLYVIDFGEQSSVGFTADEVAELLESEKFKDVKVYKIHNAYPDGRLELKGVTADTFQLESGMLFYAQDNEKAEKYYNGLIDISVTSAPPCRAKVHLAKYADDSYVVALIYPAEYDDEVSGWLLQNDYKTEGLAEGGYSAVQGYYDAGAEVLKRHQLFGESSFESRSGDSLLVAAKLAVQR